MRCSLDKVLLDARQLANRIRATDETADVLIKQASEAHNRVIAKKQCQEEIMSFEELNQISRARPRARLMMCIAAENKQLELLRQENKVLRSSLNEYETTFEMIMRKFRKHKNIMKKLEQIEHGELYNSGTSNSASSATVVGNAHSNSNVNSEHQIVHLCWKITQLQKAIEKALSIDNKTTNDLTEIESKLQFENQELRRLIEINEEFKNDLQKSINSNNNSNNIDCHPNNYANQSSPQSRIPKHHHHHQHQQHHPSPNQQSIESIDHSQIITIVNGNFGGKETNNKKNPNRFPTNSNHSATKITNNIDNNRSSASSIIAINDDDDDDHSSVASDASVKTLI